MQKQILLPLEVLLRLKIAMLERDLMHMQARLLQTEAERLHVQSVAQLLHDAHIDLPVPLSVCTLDMEQGCLVYPVDATCPENSVPA